jgi:predicted secreted protein
MSAVRRFILLAAAALAVLLVVAAVAGAKKPAQPQPTPAQAKQIAKLEALTATLAKELAGLEARSTALAAKAATVPVTPPSILPFQGLAGGALTDSYPDPRLAAATVGATALTSGSVTSAAVRNGSLTGADVEDGSLTPPVIVDGQINRSKIPIGAGDALNLGSTIEWPPPSSTEGQRTIFPGEFSAVIKLGCPAGTTLLTGGWEWSDENGNGTTMFESHPAENSLESGVEYANQYWEWRPKVLPNVGTENTFKPKLLCLLD